MWVKEFTVEANFRSRDLEEARLNPGPGARNLTQAYMTEKSPLYRDIGCTLEDPQAVDIKVQSSVGRARYILLAWHVKPPSLTLI